MPPKHFLTSNFRVAFEEYFKPDQQRSAVDNLQEHIATIRDGTEEQRREQSVLRPQDTTQEQMDARVAAHLDKCYWQLAQFYRYSNPCRIAEAEPCLREVLRYAREKNAKRDVNPELYLAVAIHAVPGKEQEALDIFASAFDFVDIDDAPPPGPRSELWARASWARLLRKMDRTSEAGAQEAAILNWALAHPLVLSPAKLKALVGDETDSGFLNNISENPDLLAAVERARERARGRKD
ncbi:uncharacterized protein BXZ73DRAFT_89898 [Epithele typhae]|uniref:uncharacterized protein n=1 Tax=Epithele typhae TaxID=378194 RepID=UPI002007B0BB|nr:uncharacterized protein BXZ73DRAFT_89898 [Epithele typhae]KAH9932742.1 hypothetical protein BXZ73DRAFT_89898 [Epithele typhae]